MIAKAAGLKDAIARVTGAPLGGSDPKSAAADASASPDASPGPSSGTDATPPTITAAFDGTQGTNDWYTSDVTITWTVTDDGSAVSASSGCDQAVRSEDTTVDGTTYTCTATSDGGTSEKSVTVKRDATKPHDVTVAAQREPDHDGWYNHPVVVVWNGTDDASGIFSCSSTEIHEDAADGSMPGSCTDNAGNTSDPVSFAYKYDGAAPVVTAVPSRGPDHNGWYNHPFDVAWQSSDDAAACDPSSAYAGPDAATTSVSGSCTDQAGNTGSATYDFRYDVHAPVITITTPAGGNPIYLLHQDLATDYACSDETSGTDSCAGPVASGGPLDTSTVGDHHFTVNATDQAGNEADPQDHPYRVQYAPVGPCGGVIGHAILEPIGRDGSRTFTRGSTVPAKFRVCDALGNAITTPGVVAKFSIIRAGSHETDQSVSSTSNHESFRSGDQQWIFNINTRSLGEESYVFRIALNDGTNIDFGFHLR